MTEDSFDRTVEIGIGLCPSLQRSLWRTSGLVNGVERRPFYATISLNLFLHETLSEQIYARRAGELTLAVGRSRSDCFLLCFNALGLSC